MRHVIFAVAHDGGDGEALDVADAVLAVTVADVVDGALVVLLEDVDVEDVLAHELLFRYRCDDVLAVAVEDNHVVYGRAVAYEFVLLQPCADESLFTVDVELFVRLDDLGGFDGVEVTQLRAAGEVFAVLFLQHTEPIDGVFHDVGKVTVYLLDVFLHTGNQFFRLV